MRRALVFRHGILLNRFALLPVERFFRRLGYEVHNRSYPTTRKRIEEHARDLADDLSRIDADLRRGGEPYEIHVVTHSLGGLVLRYAATHFEIPSIRRAVLIAPPNRGSHTARYFKNFFLYRWLFGGNAGRQLTEEPPGIFGEAGIPQGIEIGIADQRLQQIDDQVRRVRRQFPRPGRSSATRERALGIVDAMRGSESNALIL
jgi:pimeloyl-ACP methyl ester carboxylesterase